jgi:uncharacterized protein YifN (PemK superfamily)
MSGNINTKLGAFAAIVATLYYILKLIKEFSSFQIPGNLFNYVTIGLAIASLVLLVITLYKWKYDDSKELFLFSKKKYFIVLTLFTLSLFFFVGSEFSSTFSKSSSENLKERIVVLIPLNKNKSNEPAYQDGKRQAYGYVDLIEKNSEILDNYEIVFKNHEMNTAKAVEIVAEELEKGTNYFISTMSHISERLSLDFEYLVEIHKHKNKDKPKLIATVSSSSKISVKTNRVYRFYIRSNEESDLLARYYSKQNSENRLISITVNDNYGNRAREIFNDTYSKPFDINVPLEIKWNKEKIKQQIQKKIAINTEENTFFIVHYGNGLDNIISILDELDLKGQLLISHPITVNEWNKPIENILSKYNWATCYPESPSGEYYESEDIIRDFVYFTLHRLIKSIDASKVSAIDFNKAWTESDEPNRIKYKINLEGDSEIKLKIKTHYK